LMLFIFHKLFVTKLSVTQKKKWETVQKRGSFT